MMPCTQCGRMTPMPEIRFVPDGKVPGVVNIPKNNAVCSRCIKKDRWSAAESSTNAAEVRTDSERMETNVETEVVDSPYPF